MTKRKLLTLVTALLALPLMAITNVTLPFRLAGTNVYAGTSCQVTFDNQQKTAFRLDGITRSGRVYYLSQEQALLFERTTINSGSDKTFIEATGNQKLLIYFKDTNTISVQGGFAYGQSSVVQQGNATSSNNLTVTTKQAFVRSGSDVRLSHLINR